LILEIEQIQFNGKQIMKFYIIRDDTFLSEIQSPLSKCF